MQTAVAIFEELDERFEIGFVGLHFDGIQVGLPEELPQPVKAGIGARRQRCVGCGDRRC